MQSVRMRMDIVLCSWLVKKRNRVNVSIGCNRICLIDDERKCIEPAPMAIGNKRAKGGIGNVKHDGSPCRGLIDPVPRLYPTLRVTVKQSIEKIRQQCYCLIVSYARCIRSSGSPAGSTWAHSYTVPLVKRSESGPCSTDQSSPGSRSSGLVGCR